MKWIAAMVVAVGLVGAAYVSRAAEEGSRPPGVAAQDWVRISDRLGFVVVPGKVAAGVLDGDARTLRAAPEHVGADLMPPLKGYFVVQTPTGWRTVVMADPATMAQ